MLRGIWQWFWGGGNEDEPTPTPVRRFRCDGRGPTRFAADGNRTSIRCDGRGTPNRFECNEAVR
jgi:hypothetical protein